ncbi:MAG: hypothetical protein C5B52_07430 [Bacteroidetes bacterium]|nr:MAG: hypothetical protein C5B52_07430 [Bacteroidota bacterium]
MYRFLALLTIIAAFLYSCGTKEEYHKPNDPLEAGRDFIRFALDGKMKEARAFILPDADNVRLFDKVSKDYENTTDSSKAEFKKASIIINKVSPVNDSTTIINFANSYRRKNNEIKLVKSKGEWWVDFKYTFTGNLPIE